MTDSLLRTPLFDLHQAHNARMVPFAGYEMPLQYDAGIVKEHQHTRAQASLFDVSHMGQVRLAGPDALAGLEALMPVDAAGLPPGRQRYGFFTSASGGILDDLMVANVDEALLLVLNAARKEHDVALLRRHLAGTCTVERLDDRALLALQGPAAARVMEELAPRTASMAFMDVIRTDIAGADCYVSRSGYTGEDGFEISVPADAAEALARELLADREVALAGLGARDSLRLEAGLCLYGQDLDETTTPVEADLLWAVPAVRRPGGERPGGYPGARVIESQLTEGVGRKRVGLLPQTRVPARAGSELLDAAGRSVGAVTSGGFGPTLGAPVAMGYVATPSAEAGTQLSAVVRGKPVPVQVARLPAVPRRYRRS